MKTVIRNNSFEQNLIYALWAYCCKFMVSFFINSIESVNFKIQVHVRHVIFTQMLTINQHKPLLNETIFAGLFSKHTQCYY